jgi:hypothetical protein
MHWFAAQADHAAETAASLAYHQSVRFRRSMSPPRSPSSVGRYPACSLQRQALCMLSLFRVAVARRACPSFHKAAFAALLTLHDAPE